MPIRVECSACRVAFKVREEYAGRRGRCPQCKAPVEVPAARAEPAAPHQMAEAAEAETYTVVDPAPKARAVPARATAASSRVAQVVAPTRPSQTPAQILAAFRGEIAPVRPTLLYRLWILIVAGMMLLLPMIYVALIGLVGFALAMHAVHDVVIFQSVRNGKAAVMLYVGPLIVGVVVIAFMLKPLFARPAKRLKTRALDPSVEPLLFAFVDGVCTSVGAPRPSRIEVDCEVNASARRAAGPLAVFDNELVLTIGLPLVAGLSLQQFAGVLAHEFGHFSQGLGMRLSVLIRTINAWFARVVYERDEWDETLASWSTGGNGYMMALGWLARAAVWLSRRILWVLMIVGHAASGFLLRQMEFDADRYEARMVGGDVFAETMRRLGELGVAAQGAYADLASSWQERRLPDDLPKLILANAHQIPDAVRQALREAESQRRTGLFDTHPANKDRIARAHAEGAGGIFRLDGPAHDLFRDFDSLSRVATFDHYRSLLGPNLTRDQLYPVADAIRGQEAVQQGQEAFDRFFLDGFGMLQALPLPPGYPTAPGDLKAAKRALVEARKAMEVARDDNAAAQQRWGDLHDRSVKAEAAGALLKSGNRIQGPDFGLEAGTLKAVEAANLGAESGFREMSASCAPFEAAAARRLTLVLGLLESDAVAARVTDGPTRRDEARALYPCAAFLGGRLVRELPPVIRSRQAVGFLIQMLQQGKNEKNQALINACLRAGRQLHERLQELHWKIGDSVVYPFEHAQEEITLGRFALPLVPPHDAVGDLMQASDEALGKLGALYRRVLGRLAVTAEEVERALGLPPLTVEDRARPEAALV